MSSALERLLVLAAPLFAAVSKKGKPKSAPRAKAPRRTTSRAIKRPAAKPPARASKSTRAGASSKAAPARAATPAAPRPAAPAQPKPPAPTGRAILLAPANNTLVDSMHPHFRWLSVGGANRYEVVWSERPDFADSHTVTSAATEATVPEDQSLRIGPTYSWRVRGGNEGGWGPWSSTASFQVLETIATP